MIINKPLHINIIARQNGVGLDSDVSLLKMALEKSGYEVTVSHCRARKLISRILGKGKDTYDVNLFLERVFPNWFGTAKMNLLIPNQERFPERHLGRLSKIDYVLCKTKHAEEVFSQKGSQTKFIGFTSRDVHVNDEIANYRTFFHLAGKSTLKGTDTLLSIWEKHPDWPFLTILQHKDNAPEKVPNNVRLIAEYIPYDELIKLQNKHGIHLCPSLSEGWGHYIVEAMSCRACVVTTDAPPMNELVRPKRGVLVTSHRSEPRHLGTNYYVDPEELEKAIEALIHAPVEDIQTMGTAAREWFVANHRSFEQHIQTVFSDITRG